MSETVLLACFGTSVSLIGTRLSGKILLHKWLRDDWNNPWAFNPHNFQCQRAMTAMTDESAVVGQKADSKIKPEPGEPARTRRTASGE